MNKRIGVVVIKTTLCLLVMFTLCGCGNFAKSVRVDDEPDPEAAYLYGSFKQMKPSGKSTGKSGVVAISIADNKTSEEDQIRFGFEGDVLCFGVEPGCYHVSKWVCYDRSGRKIQMEQDISEQVLGNNFCLEAGKAYYLGDFTATSEYDSALVIKMYLHELKVPEDNFDEKTKLLDQTYPSFSSLTKEKIFKGNFFKEEFNEDHATLNQTIFGNKVKATVKMPKKE